MLLTNMYCLQRGSAQGVKRKAKVDSTLGSVLVGAPAAIKLVFTFVRVLPECR